MFCLASVLVLVAAGLWFVLAFRALGVLSLRRPPFGGCLALGRPGRGLLVWFSVRGVRVARWRAGRGG